ncbi:MAG: 7TM-DISM domain-containing protein, partial [Pseudomonadota bacterium]
MLMRYCQLWLLGLCLSYSAYAAPPLVLETGQNTYSVGMHLDVLEDLTGELEIEQVSSIAWHDKFTASTTKTPGFGSPNSAHWFRLKVQNSTIKNKFMLLKIQSVQIELLDVYVDDIEGWRHSRSGRD